MVVELIVGVGNQRGALPTEGNVGRPEVRDGRDAGARCNDAGFPYLQCGSSRAAEVGNRRTLMKNGLPVAPDQRNLFCSDPKALASGQRRFSKNLAQTKIELAQLTGRDGLLLSYAKNFFPQSSRKFNRGVVDKLSVETRRRPRDFRQSNINSIGGSAGHEAKNEKRVGFHLKASERISPQSPPSAQRRK